MSIHTRNRPGRVLAAAAFITSACLLMMTACSSSDTSTGDGSSPGADAASIPPYSGPESDLPTSYGLPAKKPGKTLTFGYLNNTSGNELTNALGEGFEAEAKFLGAKTIVLDSQLKVDREVSNFQQLLAQRVDGILVNPLDPKALSPLIKQAQEKGIPLIGVDVALENGELPEGFTGQIMKGADHQAYETVKAIAAEKAGAKFGILNIAFPVAGPLYQMERSKYWAAKFGLEFAGERSNATDDSNGAAAVSGPMLSKDPDLDAIIAYNDPSALGAVTAARASGRELIAAGSNGGSDGIGGVKAGKLLMTTSVDAVRIGAMALAGLYNVRTDQNLPLPKSILVAAKVVTRENADSFASFDELADSIERTGLTATP
ncbi:sugar ABC transporter substrate-binding protein [Rhodococcus sp. LB1]|uniref:sugar ABC transporter substrate-binding protein n=1 Tax=Rhodococcus sp. LB1 TaxID=1807499 RepID=UPI000A82B506|nr:sugar ABC transporter substrate-binding protein [Rhodococcus sp. LB1]